MKKIVVVGSSNTDLIVTAARIPSPSETVMGGEFHTAGGGKGANQAVAVARLGGDVKFIARIGDDLFGHGCVNNFKKDGLDTSSIIVDSQHASGVALICVDSKGENSIVVAAGANGALSKEDIDAHADDIESADYLLMQLEIPIETVEYAARLASRSGTKVIVNPAPAAKLSDELMKSLYLITPNRTECQLLTGVEINDRDSAIRAADVLLAKGVRNVIITLGTHGALVKNREVCELIPAFKVQAIDTTAAGDVFNGALCVALSEGKSLTEAAVFASKASSIAVTRMGAQTSIPTRTELDA